MTVLDAYCEAVGWQGGTIHQCLRDFPERSESERRRIWRYVLDRVDPCESAFQELASLHGDLL